ncbi:pantoate--beta-alanine ligase [Wohlfahrtiimonas populi]|uniref:pantoate--beta-alanine ligase n=1 Tax=Wohlfahrtiimonas populi TaxID=1940240 RepID=UPI00098D61E4|nr:pantoate--beta-alanine ligase [Wohlfahrtiimonas populi]
MQVIQTISELRALRNKMTTVALVPTMGNLHEGHLSLVKRAKEVADYVIVSIFVNPIQFGENEDFGSYPRTLDADCEKLAALGIDAVFAPTALEMYPNGSQSVRVVPSDIQNELCGATRAGHFNGVTTVVSKLFNIVQPNFACFGEKDYQQLHIIREMVVELNFPIEIISVPICRAETGLALSSRNGYLSDDEKSRAIYLSQSLQVMKDTITANADCDLRRVEKDCIQKLTDADWVVDYISIRNRETLAIAESTKEPLIILAAAKMGSTRLLDNLKV